MKRNIILGAALTVILTASSSVFAKGDRNPSYTMKYDQSAMLIQNGGCVYDVRIPK